MRSFPIEISIENQIKSHTNEIISINIFYSNEQRLLLEKLYLIPWRMWNNAKWRANKWRHLKKSAIQWAIQIEINYVKWNSIERERERMRLQPWYMHCQKHHNGWWFKHIKSIKRSKFSSEFPNGHLSIRSYPFALLLLFNTNGIENLCISH